MCSGSTAGLTSRCESLKSSLIVLNGSLDFERVRLYSVRLGIVTASSVVQQSFHLRVIDVSEARECETQFQFPGVEVHVPEDVSPYKPLYTVPQQGDLEDFSLSVVVRDSQGANCSGTVWIKVLKVFTPPLDVLLPVQNVSVLENGGAGDFVTAVQASPNVSAVFYTFVKPYPPYKIGPEDGIIRTAYNLDLEADRTLIRMVLLVRALSVVENRSGTATITVNVLDVNEHPPFCSPPIILPESWFVVVLTLTGALLLLTAGLLTWNVLARTSVQQIKDQPAVLLRASEQMNKEGAGNDESEKVSLDGSVSLSKVHVHEDVMRFDGKAQDPGKELARVNDYALQRLLPELV
ncbi:hypothetical protein MHYP_G00266310 [Metynnis hypsauchen]